MSFSRYIDHTNLKQDAQMIDIRKLCDEAKQYHFASVCVNPYWVSYCTSQLKDSDVNVCTVIGFPLGATSTASKAFEAKQAIADGAVEVDMVINVGELKSGHDDAVYEDIKAVADAAQGYTLKVIIETCLLTDEEKVRACELSKKAGAQFVKTSTGFSTGGANVHDVRLMKETVGDACEVKASGGIHTRDQMMALIEAGASRIGASAGIALISDNK